MKNSANNCNNENKIPSNPLECYSLASGSNGNCYYFKSGRNEVLVDCGISLRKIETRLNLLGSNLDNINAIFLTHEHTDHISGIKNATQAFVKNYNIPVFTTEGTATGLPQNKFLKNRITHITHDDKIKIGNMQIKAFEKPHDAKEPVSFTISTNEKIASVLTDIGCVTDTVKHNIKKSDVLFMEANYDIDMLKKGKYPHFLKARIAGENGHLSNIESGITLLEHANNAKNIFLSHLSINNNNEELAFRTIDHFLSQRKDHDKINLTVAARDDISKEKYNI